MAKLRTTKFQTYPQPYQFGGLNLPFLDQYTNLNKQWGSFWRGGDYFKQQAPNSIPDGTTMLDTTVKRNQGALDLYTDTQTRANNNYKGEWGDDAHNFYYRKDWDKRNPNATQADKDRFDQYASFEKTAGNLKGPDYTEALLGAGIDPGDYNSWYKARDRGAGQFGAAYDKSRDIFNKDLPAARKQMGQAMTNSAAGIFSGLNYMNSYTPPETINMQQGSKGIMYQDGGYVKGPGMKMSPMMSDFGAIQPQNSNWAYFPSGNHAIDAIDSLLFSGRSKYYTPKTKVAEALSKYSGGDYSNHKYAKKTLGSLNANERTELLNDIIKKEVSASNYAENYAGAIAGRQIGPSITNYQVTSRQEGGNVNLEGYTPGYPSMNNNMNEIPSGDITMEKTPIPLLAIGKGGADNGLLKVLQPQSKGYNFKSKSTVEIPLEQQQQDPTMAKYGKLIKALKSYNNGGYIRQYNDGGTPTDPISIFKSLKSKGYLQEYNENTFNKLSAEEQDMLFKAAAADFNSKQTPVQGQIIQEIRRPLVTQLDSSMMVPNQMSFDDAFAQARAQGLQQFEFNGNLFNTKIDPNAKASSGKSNSMRVINNSQAGLARDLIGNRQFGGLASSDLLYYQYGGDSSEDNIERYLNEQLRIAKAKPRNTNNDPNYMGENDLYTYFRSGNGKFIKKHKRTNKEDILDQNMLEREFQEETLWTNPAITPKFQGGMKQVSTSNNTTQLPNIDDSGNVRRAVYQAANQRPFYQEPGIDTRFMPDARFNRPSIYGNSAIYQGAPNQLQSASMIPTINPTVVEPMSGLGFNRDKLAAQMNVSNNVKLAKGGTQKVAAYQQMLKAAGYNIEVDGAWGPKTQAAYEAYTGKKAPSKTAVNSGKAKVASNITKNSNYGYNGEVVDYLKKNNIDPSGENVDAFYNNNLNIPINNNNVASNINKSKRFKNQRQGSYNEDVSKRLSSLMESDEYKKASKLERAGMLVETDPISALQLGLNVGNLTAGLRNVIIPGIVGKSMSDAAAFSSIYSGIIQGMAGVPTGAAIANYDNAINNPEVMNPYIKNNVLAPTWIDAIKYIPKFQFGGSVNDEHSIPVFSSNLEDFGLTELQTEKDEVAFMPDGSIVDVKAKELHKKQDKHNVSDIMQSGTYVFSNDPKMKFGIKSKIGGVELGEMKLGKSVFKYKENEITPGPEDIMLKTMFFNNSKKELTTADIAKNVKKNLPIIDLKNDYFADRAIAENKDQRLEYLSILKAFNEFKKPKSRSMPKAQYGMPIQPTQNGLDGVMGYGDKQMDPFKRMDNNMISMWNMPQPKLPTIPRMYENGGTIPQAQFGWLADGIDAIGGWSRRAKRDQERKNAILAREAQGYRDELQRGVNTAGGIGVGTNLATYAAALNVPLQKYDDQSEQMSLYNAAANRAAQRLEASKYTASQGIGSASSLARYSNPTNYGDYLSKVQSQSDSNIGRINQAIADLDMQRANANVGFISNRNAGRNQSLNARDTQLYNANLQGIGNVGRSAQEAIFNTADTKYRLGNEKMAHDAYLTDKAEAAKQAKQQQIRGYANDIGLLGLTYATGGFGGKKLFDKGTSSQAGQPSFTGFNPATFSGPNFQNPAQMSPIEQRFNSNYNIQPLPPLLNRNGVNTGNFLNRNTDNWDYNFFDVNTWRY